MINCPLTTGLYSLRLLGWSVVCGRHRQVVKFVGAAVAVIVRCCCVYVVRCGVSVQNKIKIALLA
jgi:hypothetical protein